MVTAIVRRYAVTVVLLAVAIVLTNVMPSVSKTVTSSIRRTGGIPSDVTLAATPGTPGITVGGVRCGPGVRQVPWSHYAPVCVPKWSGNNGGATAPGVTRSTITLTYREASSSELSTIYSIVPPSVIGTNTEAIQTMQAYINTFNKTFELYGRKVVLKPFVGKGDFVTELNGKNQTGAMEDALTAKGLGAFADSSVIDATPLYDEALAQQGVIGLTIYGGPNSEFQQESPYLYTTGTVCSKTVAQTEQLVGRVLNTTPTSFAGSPSLNGKKRVFGLVGTATAQSEKCDAQLVQGLKQKFGITLRSEFHMDLNGSTLDSQATTVAGEMKADGVTTVLCSTCDFFTPIFVTLAADTANYHPEWIETDFLTALTSLQAPDQIANAEGFGNQALPAVETEAYRAFELGAAPGEKLIPSFSYVYEPLLMFFDAVQSAGPYLTAKTFQEGFRSLPASVPGGMYGNWSFNSTSFDPNGSYGVVHWSNSALSPIDGKPGAWLQCNGGRQYNYDGSSPQLPEGVPLNCSGSTDAVPAATSGTVPVPARPTRPS